ncbi:ATP-binding protein [Microbacterium sp.]|uniref:sensor histidine kinase n=1 Tax=Microbacterium sp. TaxID=51671 RepID=UPI003221CDF1
MPSPVPIRSGPTRSLRRALWLIGAGALTLGVAQAALTEDGFLSSSIALTVMFWLYTGVGLLVWWGRPSNAMGFLIVLGGAALALANFETATSSVLVVVGAAFATSVLAVTVHLLLAFPTGRLRAPAARVVTAAGYVVSLGLQIPLYVYGNDRVGPVTPDSLHIAAVAQEVQSWSGLAVMAATVVIMIARVRLASPPVRKVIAPLYGYGAFAVIFVPLGARLLRGVGAGSDVISIVQLTLLAGIPVVIAVSLFTGRFARTGELTELGSWLNANSAGRPAELADALARTLGDPSLRILFRDAGDDRYLDADGATVEAPAPESGRALSEIRIDRRHVGALEYDAELVDDPQMVRKAGDIVALAVDRERLTAELRAAELALRRSRARVVDATDRERRRIATDLHDGIQARLVLLAVDAQRLAGTLQGSTREQAITLRKEIDRTAADLRALVRGVMPSALIERGLVAAVEDLTDRLPMPVVLDVDVPDGSVEGPIESVAYFVVAEAVSNAVKHSGARRATVRLRRGEDALLVEISDDGAGDATLTGTGSGLRSLADRVDAVGGIFRIDSAPGTGTRLRVELPCGW